MILVIFTLAGDKMFLFYTCWKYDKVVILHLLELQ